MNLIAYAAGEKHAGMEALAIDALVLIACFIVLFISRRNKDGTPTLPYNAGMQEELYYELQKLTTEEPNVNWRDEIAPVVKEDADNG
jgi:hypothetical protein